MKPLTSIGFLFIFCISLQQTVALPINRLDHGKRKETRVRMQNDPCLGGSDEADVDPFLMEGALPTSTTPQPQPQVFDFEEAALDRKLLGVPGWEYLTVSLVILAVTGIGGAVAIVCKKCGVLFGRRVEKDNDETHENN